MCLVHICQQNLLPARIFSRSVSEEWTSALKQVGLSALLIIFLLAAAVRAENKEYLRYFSTSWFSFSNFSTEGTAGFEPPPEQQQLQNQVAIGGHSLPGQQQYPVMYEGAVTEAGLPEQPAHPIGGAEGGAYDEQLAAQFLQTMQKTSNGDNFSKLEKGVGGGGMLCCCIRQMGIFTQTLWNDIQHTQYSNGTCLTGTYIQSALTMWIAGTEWNCKHFSSYTSTVSESTGTQFKISVYYRGVKVLEQMVENEAGVRLVYR